jgi:hypothetical protein
MAKRPKQNAPSKKPALPTRQLVFASLRAAGSMQLALSELQRNHDLLQEKYRKLEKVRVQYELKLQFETPEKDRRLK